MKRVLAWGLILLALVASVAAAWTKDDHEIFDLVSELEAHEGKGTDFYTFLGALPGASGGALNKAYRKRSLELHPDKNPNTPEVHARFARLGKVNAILRNGAKRERYDFFYKNGVPRWRGTGYYYARYRPGLVEVLLFLVALSAGVHYLVLRLQHGRDRERVKYFRTAALRAAGMSADGDAAPGLGLGRAGRVDAAAAATAEDALSQAVNGADGAAEAPSDSAPKNRKERRAEKKAGPASAAPASKGSTPLASRSGSATPGGTGSKRRKVKVPLIEGSDRAGSLDLVVVDREVFVPEQNGELTPLSALARPPTLTALWPARLVLRAASAASTAFASRGASAPFVELEDESSPAGSNDEDGEGEEGAPGEAGKKKRRNGNGKVAGMRRRKALAGK